MRSTLILCSLLAACASTPLPEIIVRDPATDVHQQPSELTVYFRGGYDHRDVLLVAPATLRAQGYQMEGFQRRPVFSRFEVAIGTYLIRIQAIDYPQGRPLCRAQLSELEAVCGMAPLRITEVHEADGTCAFEIPLDACYGPRPRPRP